jgi:hypothetical protein
MWYLEVFLNHLRKSKSALYNAPFLIQRNFPILIRFCMGDLQAHYSTCIRSTPATMLQDDSQLYSTRSDDVVRQTRYHSVDVPSAFLSLILWWSPLFLRPLLVYLPALDYGECGVIGGMLGKLNGSTQRKPAPVPFCPPQIPSGMTRARTRAAAVGSQRLTA